MQRLINRAAVREGNAKRPAHRGLNGPGENFGVASEEIAI
jgi:hypothetical protein